MRFMLCVPYNNNTGNGPQQDVAVMARQGKPIFVRVSSTEIGLDSLKRTQQKQIKSNTLSSYPDGPRRWGPAHGNIHVSSVRDSRRKSPLAPRTGVMSVWMRIRFTATKTAIYAVLFRRRRCRAYFSIVPCKPNRKYGKRERFRTHNVVVSAIRPGGGGGGGNVCFIHDNGDIQTHEWLLTVGLPQPCYYTIISRI